MAMLRRLSREPAVVAEALRSGKRDALDLWDTLVSGAVDAILVGGTEGGSTTPSAPRYLLPGSFNPIHEGHRRMLGHAAARLGDRGAYELAVLNPDKPPLSPADAAGRLSGFAADEAVWLTRAPTFPEKVRIFPGATFAVGVDTMVRIAEPHYYGGGAEGLRNAIFVLGACRFLVFGRRTRERFETLDSISIPASLRARCDAVSESDFRADISSTEIRRARAEAGGWNLDRDLA